ncbi:MAG: HAD family hydrolase [Chloroflexi bacterium]|nr:HAD family hydrolase [Chloroflexota bacterium]
MRYTHVLLDFDRTLNDSDLVYEKNLNGFLGLTGQQVLQRWEQVHREILVKEPKERHEDMEFHYKMMLEELARTDAETVKNEIKRRIKAAQEECWDATELFDEALPFLDRMKDAGYTMHIATGDYAKRKAEAIEAQAKRSYFQHTFDEETLGVGKGGRDYFDRILHRLAVLPAQVAIVGDNPKNDIVPGIESGLASLWLRRKNEKSADGMKPDVTAATLMEMLPHFLPD